jgi:type VI secretion system protein ImpH
METSKRQSNYPLDKQLAEEFFEYSFFKLIHLLDSNSSFYDKKRVGEASKPEEEIARFGVMPGFQFPPSDISELVYHSCSEQFHIETAFLGLIGPSGVLPNWYNELALETIFTKDNQASNRERNDSKSKFALVDFLNIFHHRLHCLFYLAWKKNCFLVNYQPNCKDNLSWYLLCLLGLGTEGLPDIEGVPKEFLAFYSGLLSQSPASVATIEAVLSFFTETAVHVEQYVERPLKLKQDEQTQIGKQNALLGENTVCGNLIWESQTKFLVRLGPMNYDQFLTYLPNGSMIKPAASLLQYMVSPEYEFEFKVYLNRKETPKCVLGVTELNGVSGLSLLGWTTWIKTDYEIEAKEEHFMTLETDPFITL